MEFIAITDIARALRSATMLAVMFGRFREPGLPKEFRTLCADVVIWIEDFQRRGLHSRDGALTLENLLQRVTAHIPHHVRFIEEKRRAMA